MNAVTNIIDALRRIGSTTQKSALSRQDAQLEGKEVLERRQINICGDVEQVNAFVATVKTYPETITRPSPEQIAAVKENAALVGPFLRRYSEGDRGAWDLRDLDKAFEKWITSAEKSPYDDEATVQILGAAFGEYCAQHLNMEWVLVNDADGQALGLIGVEKDFRGFPHFSVRKRIPLVEFGFFEPVFQLLKEQEKQARERTNGL